ncbi:MAG: dihydrofolate reductase family protein [Candidatus Shapirobacteria bacterium]|nr:dihydrofolate reductase family protein [Candidatus Shapirobacteria bacterium]
MSKVILVAATSIDNKITCGSNGDSFSWTSPEDQKYFTQLIKDSDLVIMGRKTYQINSSKMDLTRGPLRLVLTKNPKKYSHLNIPGHLEFTSLTPPEISSKYFSKYNQILILGGSQIYSLFLKDNLIDEIYLTIEPVIFGNGKNLLNRLKIDQSFRLVDFKQLNRHGTLLLKYQVIQKNSL